MYRLLRALMDIYLHHRLRDSGDKQNGELINSVNNNQEFAENPIKSRLLKDINYEFSKGRTNF